MSIFGALIVQNEADIIEELLEFLGNLDLFERIFFVDLGSKDGTFARALKYRDLLSDAHVVADVPYSNPLRMKLLLKNRHYFRDGDWLSIIDADEFYVSDPREVIERAEQEGADSIATFQAEYFLTDRDLDAMKSEDLSLPVRERRRHYLIDWSEVRFYKYLPLRREGPVGSLQPCREKILNRHYQYRDPEQIQTRIRTRIENRNRTRGQVGAEPWDHVFSEDWRDFVVPESLLFRDDGGPLQFGVPEGVSEDAYQKAGPLTRDMFRLADEMQREHEAMLGLEPIRRVARDETPPRRPVLIELGVTDVQAGSSFNTQPDGTSAIWVRCAAAKPGTIVFFDGEPLPTVFSDATLLTASVSPELLAKAGRFPIWLTHAGLESNRLEFTVLEPEDLATDQG